MEDLVQILTVFSCRLQGKRANKAKKRMEELTKMIKTYKVMLLPNNKQKTKLFQYADAARFAYNWALEKQMKQFEHGGSFLSDSILRKEFTQLKKTEEGQWLNEISNNVTKQAIKDCCMAYQNFFREYKKTGVKYSKQKVEHFARIGKRLTVYEMKCHPKFKSKKRATPKFYQDNVKIKFTDTHVKVEGFAGSKKKNKQKLNWIRLAEHGRIPTDCKYTNPRIKFDGEHWWLMVGVEEENCRDTPTGEGMGIDLGIKELAVCSDETRYKNINKTRGIKQLEKKKCRLQRAITRKYEKNKKGESYCKTSNIRKSEEKLLKINHRLTNIRQNYIHQITSKMIKREPSFICMEDLNVRGMMKNRQLSKAIQEQCFGEFRRQIEYKSAWSNGCIVIADRFYPSSKLCSCCGNIKKDLKLKDRIYRCEKCGNTMDRDYQAALNLKRYGEQVVQSAM